MPIDIEIVLDAGPLLERHPNPSQEPGAPTKIDSEEAFIVAAPRQHVRHHGSNRLELVSGKGDELRWYMQLMARDGYNVILYGIRAHPFGFRLTTPPAMKVSNEMYPVPIPDDPTRYIASDRIDVSMECNVAGSGKQAYTLLFYIVGRDDVDGNFRTLGYFSWKSILVLRKPHGH
ncbi:hypothetical protein CHL67_08915 [Prosthecochloris sp. GSB1]|uniref:AidA/PixA family protein n=1 Tax=Prosthecochloris sp. GSB1 TaxID=281093 RepID=UPI000B8C73D6|nr:AidA/PixA family protein [Prosthecochloris sp. GSB1]ASQ91024.1 hypothetical protein CHL67_08915 [Prosthecochloris sp. GSB1]